MASEQASNLHPYESIDFYTEPIMDGWEGISIESMQYYLSNQTEPHSSVPQQFSPNHSPLSFDEDRSMYLADLLDLDSASPKIDTAYQKVEDCEQEAILQPQTQCPSTAPQADIQFQQHPPNLPAFINGNQEWTELKCQNHQTIVPSSDNSNDETGPLVLLDLDSSYCKVDYVNLEESESVDKLLNGPSQLPPSSPRQLPTSSGPVYEPLTPVDDTQIYLNDVSEISDDVSCASSSYYPALNQSPNRPTSTGCDTSPNEYPTTSKRDVSSKGFSRKSNVPSNLKRKHPESVFVEEFKSAREKLSEKLREIDQFFPKKGDKEKCQVSDDFFEFRDEQALARSTKTIQMYFNEACVLLEKFRGRRITKNDLKKEVDKMKNRISSHGSRLKKKTAEDEEKEEYWNLQKEGNRLIEAREGLQDLWNMILSDPDTKSVLDPLHISTLICTFNTMETNQQLFEGVKVPMDNFLERKQ